jgi:Protein of unknown function (DUF2637)
MKNRRLIITAIPLVICNLIAFTGQLSFIRDHMSWPLIGDIGLAAGLESIALFLTFMAADALMAEDSAFRLRLGSYIVAGIVAALNYSHYADNGRPTFAAVATGLMSFMSPILWGIYSRRNSRDALKAKGLIESRAVKFGVNRWLWWPGRTFHVYRYAAWTGEIQPAAAITQWETYQTEKDEIENASLNGSEGMTLNDVRSKADAVRIALREAGENLTGREIATWLAERGHVVTPEYVRVIRSTERRRLRASLRALPGRNQLTAIGDYREADQGK